MTTSVEVVTINVLKHRKTHLLNSRKHATMIETAINRQHPTANEDDILQAIKSVSDDLVIGIDSEIFDTSREMENVLYTFEGANFFLDSNEITQILTKVKSQNKSVESIIDVLLWFGFLGVLKKDDTEVYSYDIGYSLVKLKTMLQNNGELYVIHSGFRKALNIQEMS